MDGYARRKPYLTCNFMWDENKDFILSSKYQPLDIGTGETGFSSSITEDTSSFKSSGTAPSCGTSNCNPSSKRTSPLKKCIEPKENLADMVSSIIGTIMKNDAEKTFIDKLMTKKKGKNRKNIFKASSINEEP